MKNFDGFLKDFTDYFQTRGTVTENTTLRQLGISVDEFVAFLRQRMGMSISQVDRVRFNLSEDHLLAEIHVLL